MGYEKPEEIFKIYYIQSNEIHENIKYNAYFKKAVFHSRENIKGCISLQ